MTRAEKNKDSEPSDDVWGEWQAELEPERDAFDRLETIYWRGRAARYRVPEPEDGDVYLDHQE
jgi:hypothetical protein